MLLAYKVKLAIPETLVLKAEQVALASLACLAKTVEQAQPETLVFKDEREAQELPVKWADQEPLVKLV